MNLSTRLRLSLMALLACMMPIACAGKKLDATDYVRTPSSAISTTAASGLHDSLAPLEKSHPGQSGFKLVTHGKESLLLRLAMIQSAEKSLDVQYYIMENDTTGKLLLEAILRAADRGVRVRILMDDLNLHQSDPVWALLNTHKHIEVRIFNPFATNDESLLQRTANVFTGLWQFSKRMHNKMLIADNQVAISGGRNLGDAYFGASGDFNFRDVDVVAAGPIVGHMSQSFDKYWNDDAAFPITALFALKDDQTAAPKLREELQANWKEQVEKGDVSPLAPLTSQIESGQLPLLWAQAELAADAPSKIDLPSDEATSKPGAKLGQAADKSQREFIIVSPYFVPGTEVSQWLISLVEKGVKVRVLTNSLASIDVVAAHVGYRRYREELLKGGVDLYEMKPIPGSHPHSERYSSSSRDSLHSKIYVVDRRTVVVGSFNLDQRSVKLNTESVLVIHSHELAEQVAAMFEKAIAPDNSYRLTLESGHLEWIDNEKQQEKIYESEPEAGFWRRAKENLFSLLPIESQL